jgi:Ca2+-binding EF-hand superfamily protein
MEKNKDIVLAKELFSCWDERRIGTINIDTLSENLISFGLSMSRDQVVKLIQAISSQGKEYKKVEEITMKEFVKIFERDPFGDKVVDKIKEEWEADRKAKLDKIVSKIIRKRSVSGSRVSDSDV